MVIVLQLLWLKNLNDIHEPIVCLHIDSGVEGCIDMLQNRLSLLCGSWCGRELNVVAVIDQSGSVSFCAKSLAED